MKKLVFGILFFACGTGFGQNRLEINDLDYFEMNGLDVTVFSDFYPEGHQSGVTIIQHGTRVAANGDLRLEATPGQWSPVPKAGESKIDRENRTITKTLWFPDSSRNRTGYNPISYPDLVFTYHVNVKGLEGNSFKVTVDLESPLPDEWIGRVGFELELFPGILFGKSYKMDSTWGIFPTQPSGPVKYIGKELTARPLASGSVLVVDPGEDLQRIKIVSKNQVLELLDGRINYNNGWFIVRSTIPAEATKNAIEWIITPNVVEDWHYKPVIQVSQLGYHPNQKKTAVIEMDKHDTADKAFSLFKLNENGRILVKTDKPQIWGR